MPKTLKSGERKMVLKIKNFCQLEKKHKKPVIPLNQVRLRVAAMTGVSEKTVTRITQEGETAASTSTKIRTPGRIRHHEKRVKLDDLDICALRHQIIEFYTVRKELPTLPKILDGMKSYTNFGGSHSTLRRILREIGFRFQKYKSKRKILLERYDITAWRIKYIKALRNNRNNDMRPLIYLGETYIHAAYGVTKCWQSETEERVISSESKGSRWIIFHAGGENGFVPNAGLIFKSQSKSGSYHNDMNPTNFMKWVEEKLAPNLPPRCLVVMANAPYNSFKLNKAPSLSSTKTEMQQWLKSKGISYLQIMLKVELFEIIKKHKENPIYEVDSYLASLGHKVIRLPPYHCDLNPIEQIWSVVKRRISERNIEQTSNILNITDEAFDSITLEEWQKEWVHIPKIEKKYYFNDMQLDRELEKIIIRVGDDSDSSSSSDSSQSSDCESDISTLQDHNYC